MPPMAPDAPTAELPTERLVIGYDPAEVAALTALHDEAQQSFPGKPSDELLVRIANAEQRLATSANAQIRAFAERLRRREMRPWFEVWYPHTTINDFDAVEVAEDGTITTLPPYSELAGGA